MSYFLGFIVLFVVVTIVVAAMFKLFDMTDRLLKRLNLDQLMPAIITGYIIAAILTALAVMVDVAKEDIDQVKIISTHCSDQ